MNDLRYTRDKTQEKTHAPSALQNVSNAATHNT